MALIDQILSDFNVKVNAINVHQDAQKSTRDSLVKGLITKGYSITTDASGNPVLVALPECEGRPNTSNCISWGLFNTQLIELNSSINNDDAAKERAKNDLDALLQSIGYDQVAAGEAAQQALIDASSSYSALTTFTNIKSVLLYSGIVVGIVLVIVVIVRFIRKRKKIST